MNSGKAPPRFTLFGRLPLELQTRIWELACPGPRLIEVYPRPRGWDENNDIIGYTWRAHRCECEEECHTPLAVSQACRESRRVFSRIEGKYARCFGTYICWENDILYVGDRTGHLHNNEFLKTIDLAGGLGKVKNLAIHEDVWETTNARHGDENLRFKRCSCVGILHELGVEHLTIVGKAGFFRDGQEFWDEIDEREWLYNSDSEIDDVLEKEEEEEEEESDDDVDSDDDEDEDGDEDDSESEEDEEDSDEDEASEEGDGNNEEDHLLGADLPIPANVTASDVVDSIAGGFTGVVGNLMGQVIQHIVTQQAERQAERDANGTDRWACEAQVGSGDARAYKPRCSDGRLIVNKVGSGEGGLALVDVFSISGPHKPLWQWPQGPMEIRHPDLKTVLEDYVGEIESVKVPVDQFYEEDGDPEHADFIDWESWLPPLVSLAFFRRTGQSCHVKDWKNLDKDYITWKEAELAKRYTSGYIDDCIRTGTYKNGDLDHIYFNLEFDAMEGYGPVKDYRSNGLEVPCTATTSRGLSYRPGNYFNSTKRRLNIHGMPLDE